MSRIFARPLSSAPAVAVAAWLPDGVSFSAAADRFAEDQR